MTTYKITRTADYVTTVIAHGLDADAAADALLQAAAADYEVEDGYFTDDAEPVFVDEPGIRVTLASGKEIWRDCEPGDEVSTILSLGLRRDGALYFAIAE